MTVRAVRDRVRARRRHRHGLRAGGRALQCDGAPLAEGAQRTEAERLLAAAHLANNAELAEREGRWTVLGDPTEGALKVAALKAGLDRRPDRGAVRRASARCRSRRSAS